MADNNPAENKVNTAGIPSAEDMLAKLMNIDTADFNLREAEDILRGNLVWLNVLAVPVTLVLLLLFTLLGGLATGHFIISFVVTALVLFMAGKMFEGYDLKIKIQARQEIEARIADTESEFGFIVHFKHFLPTRYRHLIQSLKRRRYLYIDQYIQAVRLLQNKLDHEQFTEAWHRAYPELAPKKEDLGELPQDS